MKPDLFKAHVALKMRAIAFSAKVDAALAMASLLNEAMQINSALVAHTDNLLNEINESKSAQPNPAAVPEETRQTP